MSNVEPAVPHTPRSLRARLSLSQADLAEASGVTVRTIYALEQGEDVSLDSLRRIASALGVEAQGLIEAIDAERARRASTGSAA